MSMYDNEFYDNEFLVALNPFSLGDKVKLNILHLIIVMLVDGTNNTSTTY